MASLLEEVRHAQYHGLILPNQECTTLGKVAKRLDSWGKGQESKIIRDASVADTAWGWPGSVQL